MKNPHGLPINAFKKHKNIMHDYSSNEKMCSKCKAIKPRTNEFFSREKKNKDGFNYLCKECQKVICKTSRKNSPRYAEYVKSPEYVYAQLKFQAKKRNIPFEISFEYYIENLAHKICYYCGSENTKHWIDRFINDHEIGYTEKNSVPCCELCNKMKISLNPQIFIDQCKKITEYGNSKEKETQPERYRSIPQAEIVTDSLCSGNVEAETATN